MINEIDNINFTGRCRQIRDAQWVCHTVNSVYPHNSTSKNGMIAYSFVKKNQEKLKEGKLGKKSFFDRLEYWYQGLGQKIGNAREEWRASSKNGYKKIIAIINQLKYEKLANCGEDSYIAETVMKLNGFENCSNFDVTINGKCLDHSVCAFQRYGEQFNGKIDKNTIIIDPWIGTADFAKNMFFKYRSDYKKLFPNIKEGGEIGLKFRSSIDLSDEELVLLQSRYKNMIYSNKNRKFMQ